MRVSELSELGGVAVEGVDLSRARSPEIDRQISDLFDQHGLVLFRGQSLTKQQLVASVDPFGGAVRNIPGTSPDPEAPGVVVVSTRGASGDVKPSGDEALVGDIDWHSDQAYVTRPNRGKILYAVQVPPEGGLTGFIDCGAAYDALPEETKRRIDDLHVIHSFRQAERYVSRNRAYHRDGDDALASSKFPDVVFPMVCRHPVTGRESLNVPPLWVSGVIEMPGEAGTALIGELQRHLLRRERQYWHRYDVGDALLWDNWRYIHAAGGTPAEHARILWSISIDGGVELGRQLVA